MVFPNLFGENKHMELKIGYPTSTGSLSFMDILGAILSIFRHNHMVGSEKNWGHTKSSIFDLDFPWSKPSSYWTIPARDHQPRDFAPAFHKARPETTLQKEWWWMLGWDSSQKILKILKVKDWNSGILMG